MAERYTPTLVFSRRQIEGYAALLGVTVERFCTVYRVVESPELPTGLTGFDGDA